MNGAPQVIRNAKASALLTLEWPDGQRSELSHAGLRAACPCSRCRAARQRGAIGVVAHGVVLTAVQAQGYGVQLVFSDGHDRGIYPWQYLRELGAACGSR